MRISRRGGSWASCNVNGLFFRERSCKADKLVNVQANYVRVMKG